MYRPPVASPVRPAQPFPFLAAPLRALFFMRATVRFDALRTMIRGVARDHLTARVDEVAKALCVIRDEPVDLLLLDAAIDPACVPVLIWHQRNARPHSLVLVFDDFPLAPDCGSYRVWSWGDAEAVLRGGLGQRPDAGAAWGRS